MHRPSSRHKDQQNKTKPNIFQRIKQTDGKDKPTLRKKAKPLI